MKRKKVGISLQNAYAYVLSGLGVWGCWDPETEPHALLNPKFLAAER